MVVAKHRMVKVFFPPPYYSQPLQTLHPELPPPPTGSQSVFVLIQDVIGHFFIVCDLQVILFGDETLIGCTSIFPCDVFSLITLILVAEPGGLSWMRERKEKHFSYCEFMML